MKKRSIYIYPTSRDFFIEGNNNYIRFLIHSIGNDFNIVSGVTRIGLLDILVKIYKCDILYFNWVEDIPIRRFGIFQVPVLFLIIAISKLCRIKVVWFIHNNISHDGKYLFLKNLIISVMKRYSDIILSHSSNVRMSKKYRSILTFDHPIEFYHPVVTIKPTEFDLLIWGTVSPYKGVSEFIDYLRKSSSLKKIRILIAGKFCSDSYYETIKVKKTSNVEIINKKLSESELVDLFKKSKYILFTYNSPSVLSSAALCKSLSYGKEVIGPSIGSFKELGNKGLIYNYESFASLEVLLSNLKTRKIKTINTEALACYAQKNGWPEFATFLCKTLNGV